ncbi:TolC family protein [Synoicihabitans lomoniglobus]|uniref:TolC family protein n=2 Tax=Synoicihabitans lomoniglobus TaxID=2909285 RepID=A0AAF0I5X4_9BACT|nr:TolC family protein [Opitutaceae bacterium LMO-M01]
MATVCGLFLGLLPVASADSSVLLPETLFPDLNSLLADASSQSPRILAQRIYDQELEGYEISAKSARLPQLSLGVSQTWGNEKRTGAMGATRADKLYYGFNVSQAIYHWGTIKNGVRVAEIRRLINMGRAQEAYEALAAEVRAQYLQLIVKEFVVTLNQYRLELASEKLIQGRERLTRQAIAPTAIFPLEIAQSRAELTTVQVESELERGKRALARLVGRDTLGISEMPETIPLLPENAGVEMVDTFMAQFRAGELNETREILALKNELKVQRINLHSVRMGLRPRLNLVAGITQDEQNLNTIPVYRYETQYVFGGLSMNWNIFDGFRTKGAVRSALALSRSAQHALDEAEESQWEMINNQAEMIRLSARSLMIEERLYASAEGALEFHREQYGRGEVAESTISTAVDDRNVALLNAMNARYSHLMAIVQFLAYIDADPAVDLFNISSR